jgi:hypothetical protein
MRLVGVRGTLEEIVDLGTSKPSQAEEALNKEEDLARNELHKAEKKPRLKQQLAGKEKRTTNKHKPDVCSKNKVLFHIAYPHFVSFHPSYVL